MDKIRTEDIWYWIYDYWFNDFPNKVPEDATGVPSSQRAPNVQDRVHELRPDGVNPMDRLDEGVLVG